MKRMVSIVLLTLLTVVALAGCGDRHDLEDLTVMLMTGVDLDDDNNLIIYESSPVFSREAKDKEEEFGVKATTFRQARGKFDAEVTAMSVGGKVQVVLLSKKLLQHGDWFQLFDAFYRDAKNSINARVVVVDGPVSEVINYVPSDKPRLPLHVMRLIDTSYRRNLTVKTTLQELHRQMTDLGITPFVSEIKKEKEIKLTGSALLNEQGKYATSLGLQETTLLRMLQMDKKGEMSLTISIPDARKEGGVVQNDISFLVQRASTKVKTAFRDRFHFDLSVNMSISLREKLFPFNVTKNEKQLEQMIEEQLQQQLGSMIKKIQKHRIDPIGLGIYARAYEYKEWLKVRDKWGEALAKSDVAVSVKVRIKSMGPIK